MVTAGPYGVTATLPGQLVAAGAAQETPARFVAMSLISSIAPTSSASWQAVISDHPGDSQRA